MEQRASGGKRNANKVPFAPLAMYLNFPAEISLSGEQVCFFGLSLPPSLLALNHHLTCKPKMKYYNQ